MAACTVSVAYSIDRERIGYGSGRTFPGINIEVEWDAGDAVSALQLFDTAVKSVREQIKRGEEEHDDERG